MPRHYTGPTLDDLSQIPAALTTRDQWVLWRGQDRVDPRTQAVTGLNKLPYTVHLGLASSTDPATWSPFTVARASLPAALEEWEHEHPANYRGGGLGFVLTEHDPLVGIDLDHVIDPQTGSLAPWAQAMVARLATYTEVSPSGQGLRLFVEGTLPPSGRKKGPVELYDRARFLTITGQRLPATPATITANQPALDALWCAHFGCQPGEYVHCVDTHGVIQSPAPLLIDRIEAYTDGTPYAFFVGITTGWPLTRCERTRGPHTNGHAPELTDQAILAHAFRATNAPKFATLWQGDTDGYPSQSEADLALCALLAFWTQDTAQLDRLFRQSGLMRDKWDEARGATTYGAQTLATALGAGSEHYSAPATFQVSPGPEPSHNGHPPPEASAWGPTFDVTAGVSAGELLTMMRVPPRFLIDKLVPDGLTILAAPAKSYKSYFALSLALATVGAGAWCDTFPVEEGGNVVFFGLEAPLMQLRNRLYQLRPDYDPRDTPHTLTFFSGMRALPTFRNGLQDALAQVIDHYRPRLIVIDPLSYLYRLGRQDDLASATLDLLWPLAEMMATAKVALLAPEHMRKRSKEDVSIVEQLAGSHIKAAVVHGLLSIHREGDDIVIETTMRDAPAQELVLTLDFDETQSRVQWGYKGTNAAIRDGRTGIMKQHVHEELKTRGYPMKVLDVLHALVAKELVKNTDQTKDQIRQILYRGERDGELACSRRGEYYWIGPK